MAIADWLVVAVLCLVSLAVGLSGRAWDFSFLLSITLLVSVSLFTRAESEEILLRFYERRRPPGLWRKIRQKAAPVPERGQPLGRLAVS